jgi:hypothetical protein
MSASEQNFIAKVKGQKCSRFMCQQFWHGGHLADEWNVLFLELSDGTWLRFLIDAGVFFWREEKPSIPENHCDDEYRLIEPDLSKGIRGREIIAAKFSSLQTGGRTLALGFEDGTTLYVHNDNDRSSVVFDGKATT